MSWRRFSTLLRGLGPNSACATRAMVRRYKENKDSAVRTVTGTPDQVSAAFVAQFGGGKSKKDPGRKAGPAPAGG